MDLSRLLFGHVLFSQSEEFDEFKYRFLIVLMVSGAVFTAIFIAGEMTNINRIQTLHFCSMHVFALLATLFWQILRGRKHLFLQVA